MCRMSNFLAEDRLLQSSRRTQSRSGETSVRVAFRLKFCKRVWHAAHVKDNFFNNPFQAGARQALLRPGMLGAFLDRICLAALQDSIMQQLV